MTDRTTIFDWLVNALSGLCSDTSGFDGSAARERLRMVDADGKLLLRLLRSNAGCITERGLTLALRLLLQLLTNPKGNAAYPVSGVLISQLVGIC